VLSEQLLQSRPQMRYQKHHRKMIKLLMLQLQLPSLLKILFSFF
jgi:hypothetical protein